MTDSPFGLVIQSMRDRLAAGQDDVVACVGYEGSGKSTLAQWLGLAVDDHFNTDNVCYGVKDFVRTTGLPPGSLRVMDEALLGAFGRRSSSTENTSNVLLVSLGRMRSIATVLCAADLTWIDPYFRTHRIRRLFRCHGDGLATYCLRLRDPPDPDDPFAPIFRFRYPMLPDEWWEDYQAKKREGLAAVEREIEASLEKKEKKTKKT